MQIVVDTRNGQVGAVADWVARFADIWRGGARNLDDFMSLFDDGVRLAAPGVTPTVGAVAGREAFRRAFAVFPDMTATLEGWAHAGDTLFVEVTFQATIGGRLTPWRGIDRFTIRDGRVVERVAFFNPLRVRRALLRRPAGWRQLLRLRSAGR